MTDQRTLRELARRWAQDAIDDWATESLYDLNDMYDVDLDEDELREVGRLASTATAVLPLEIAPTQLDGKGTE